MSEKFSFKWNDFHSHWKRSLSQIRGNNDFADVTIITDDKVKFMAHKILLSSCSETFKFILKESNQAQSILYLSGVNSVNLKFILDYIYYGEVNLFQEQLDSFLQSAEKLEMQGLVLSNDQSTKDATHIEPFTFIDPRNIEYNQEDHKYDQTEEKQIVNIKYNAYLDSIKTQNTRVPRAPFNDAGRIDMGSMSPEEIELKIKELFEKVDGVWRCLACEYKTSTNSGIIKRHIETHIDGLSYTCTLCNKEFRARNLLTLHKSRSHK